MKTCFFLKEVQSIHLTNLHNVCEYVARSTSSAAKQKLNQLKFFSQKGKVISIQFHKNGIRRMFDFFNVPKIGNLYYMIINQLQYINNHVTAW